MINKWCCFTNGCFYVLSNGEKEIGKQSIFISADSIEEIYERIEWFEKKNNCEFIKFGATI